MLEYRKKLQNYRKTPKFAKILSKIVLLIIRIHNDLKCKYLQKKRCYHWMETLNI